MLDQEERRSVPANALEQALKRARLRSVHPRGGLIQREQARICGERPSDLETPLLALGVGMLLGNLARLPDWFQSALRTEFYVKVGIVLMGATLPFTIILQAGPLAILQATIVAVTTFVVIHLAATRLFGLDPRFGATLEIGRASCRERV
mgnify:CR=1 FL=1